MADFGIKGYIMKEFKMLVSFLKKERGKRRVCAPGIGQKGTQF